MKIVINNCFGGFGLSDEAFELWLKEKGKKWVGKKDGCYYTIPIKKYKRLSEERYKRDGDYRNVNNQGWIFIDNNIPRDDKDLVKIVEKLGKRANGTCAELKVVEIPDGIKYIIEEYDGNEWVAEEHRRWS